MDEEVVESEVIRVGDRLRAARKAKKLSLEDIAAQTRIPLRHLESLEASDWENLPAPTYTIGFAKSYASAVNLDRAEISDQLRAEMGTPRSAMATQAESLEPVDPKRTMPRGLVIGAIGAVILLVLLMSWLNNRSLNGSADPVAAPETAVVAPGPVAPATVPAPQGPVVLSVTEPVWMQVYNKTGTSYYSGILQPGANFTVPADAVAPLLKTAKPEALRIMVGSQLAPTVGPAGQMVSDVSLRPADLLGTSGASQPSGSAPAAVSAAPPVRPPAPQARPSAPRSRPAAPPTILSPSVEPAPAQPPVAGNTAG